ncbi:unnamed protein product [Arabis nemorensis]|uniref:Uncharacterized protein n=1 Tax=Arabis nemorensis TaxID=586526 RepID=A0A565BHE0_9BRAS|nr:unnamed protein product [Arabis nemorensis]
MDTLATVDPANIHHIMSSNFSNYIKRPEFQQRKGRSWTFERFMLDTTFILVTGSNARSLSIGTPKADYAKALDDVGCWRSASL